VAALRHLERYGQDFLAVAKLNELNRSMVDSGVLPVYRSANGQARLPFQPDPDVARTYIKDMVDRGILAREELPAGLAKAWRI
jgi:hypothetical protein